MFIYLTARSNQRRCILTQREKGTILIVDDDPHIRNALERFFRKSGWGTGVACSGEEALESYDRVAPDVVLLDLVMPGLSGIDVLDVLIGRGATVVMLTGQGDISVAVDAMRRGAHDFLTKPVDLDHLEASALRAVQHARLRRAHQNLVRELGAQGEGGFMGRSRTMRELEERVRLVAASDSTVLLQGESGTGKGWLARRIHSLSPRGSRPFVEVNCAGLSATFLESELFGHEKGAFTGARAAKRGLLEVADEGTFFLDEIGDLGLELQPKLLKVLEDRTFRRLGGTAALKVDVRLLVATNHRLEDSVRDGSFREDLYYRLNVLRIRLPALRDRTPEDRLDLIRDSLGELAGRTVPSLSPRALDLLMAYGWPGNIRELRNTLERALVLSGDAGEILPEHLTAAVRGPDSAPLDDEPGLETLEEAEKRHIARVPRALGGNRSRTAEVLDISRTTLYAKLERYGLEETGLREA